MLQRAELHRRLDVAKAALKPGALVDRGKYRLNAKFDDAAQAAGMPQFPQVMIIVKVRERINPR